MFEMMLVQPLVVVLAYHALRLFPTFGSPSWLVWNVSIRRVAEDDDRFVVFPKIPDVARCILDIQLSADVALIFHEAEVPVVDCMTVEPFHGLGDSGLMEIRNAEAIGDNTDTHSFLAQTTEGLRSTVNRAHCREQISL